MAEPVTLTDVTDPWPFLLHLEARIVALEEPDNQAAQAKARAAAEQDERVEYTGAQLTRPGEEAPEVHIGEASEVHTGLWRTCPVCNPPAHVWTVTNLTGGNLLGVFRTHEAAHEAAGTVERREVGFGRHPIIDVERRDLLG